MSEKTQLTFTKISLQPKFCVKSFDVTKKSFVQKMSQNIFFAMSRNYASWPWLTTYATHSTMCVTLSQSYQTLISLFFQFLLLSLTISEYRQYFLMLQTTQA